LIQISKELSENFDKQQNESNSEFVEDIYEDGSIYIGKFDSEGRRSGIGRYIYSSGAIYTGEWVDGVRKG
jgi:hypothetical protein